MLAHDFTDMPGQLGDTALRCRWCNKTPMKAREDGCAIRELQETGTIPLRVFNPGGVGHFKGRTCMTCGKEIMDHLLKRDSNAYWCDAWSEQASEGINDCVYDVEGVAVPTEPCQPQ